MHPLCIKYSVWLDGAILNALLSSLVLFFEQDALYSAIHSVVFVFRLTSAETLHAQGPRRLPHLSLGHWALHQPWKGGANDAKAKRLAARQGEAGKTPLT